MSRLQEKRVTDSQRNGWIKGWTVRPKFIEPCCMTVSLIYKKNNFPVLVKIIYYKLVRTKTKATNACSYANISIVSIANAVLNEKNNIFITKLLYFGSCDCFSIRAEKNEKLYHKTKVLKQN